MQRIASRVTDLITFCREHMMNEETKLVMETVCPKSDFLDY